MVYDAAPVVFIQPSEHRSCIRNAIIKLVNWAWFDTFIMSVIGLNTLVLAIVYYDVSE